jgi:hypothetical protein
VRSLQTILLVIGATALGSAWGCIAMGLIGAFTIFRARSGEDWGTAYGMMYSGLCCGLPLGAIAGFAGAVRIAREESEDWSAIVWIGVALGVAMGPVCYYFEASQLRSDVISALIVAIVTAMFGTVGGMLAATGEGLWRRASRGQSQSVATGLGLLFVFISTSFVLVLVTVLISSQWTVFQLALLVLIGVPILCGSVMWLRRDGRQKRMMRKQKDIRNRFLD